MTSTKPVYASSIDIVAPGDGQTAGDEIARTLIADPFTRKVIHRRVIQLLRLPEFAGDSDDDLTQEFLIRLTDAMKVHCESVGHRNPYIVSIVDRYTATLLKHRRAGVRYAIDRVSTDRTISDSEIGPFSFGDTLHQRDQERRLQTRAIEPNDHSNLKSDLAALVEKLPAEDQSLLRLLRDHHLSEVAVILDYPRSTLASQLQRIAAIFEQEGLHEYLP